ncbi:Putative Rhodanese-like domain, ubiquitin specific protease, Rhodanese-like domain superfamily [Septoria linicola]|uniref:Rhodanese-like domain, ubiquitin specific protease, Rhodanese-like domain superfamily n=1 Tax=Septoria linicola TaxID=215465 RepID=A0A9Q9AP10_9PEZI|nr:Putative Rhodanese-like domain, ubiquitin specific protease, Rhodanese-like domain superfamily [Septoria linicola]
MSAAAPPLHAPAQPSPAPPTQHALSRTPLGSNSSTAGSRINGAAGGAATGAAGGGGEGGGGGGGAGSGERQYAHIHDLKADAIAGLRNTNASITQLFARAEQSLKDAKFNLDFRRPDVAFVHYMRASEIAVEVIPHHRDYIHFIHDQHGHQRLQILQRSITVLVDQYASIKQIIINNNSRSGVVPRAQSPVHHARGSSASAVVASVSSRAKPPVSPKPANLQDRPVSLSSPTTGGTNGESLSDRFAKLRTSGARTPVSYTNGNEDNADIKHATMAKPQGPRSMPLDTALAAAMPKAPSPTYSPARNMQTTGDIALPRHSVRSLAQSRKSSLIPNSIAPAASGDLDAETHHHTQPPGPGTPRRGSTQLSGETRITAEKLHDCLERFDVMVIDCRSRAEYDQGHIYSRNVICVEPIGLRQGLSAEQLAGQLVLSPQEEQEVFENRHRYDLVVYYDTNTSSETYLTNPQSEAEARLKYLHEALHDFNTGIQLRRQPIILVGGLDAWIELMGVPALVATSTQARAKQGRPIQRRPNRGGQIKLPKRLREYNPLGPEEEKKWRDRAQSESMPAASAFAEHEAYAEAGDDVDEMQKFPNIEEFNARFPDAGTVIPPIRPTSAMVSAPPSRIPMYPMAPGHSVYPPAPPAPPARPAPAAPRMSYTGVSDRAVSQSTPIPRTSSQLLPYVPPRFLAQNLRLPRTGILNFGATCYMNATLQALSATTPLTMLMLDDQYKKMVCKDNWKGSNGLLPEIYANTIRSLWQGGVDYIKPSTLRTFCGRLKSTFKDPHQQQDAQEFFSFMVDTLHEDFNAVWNKTPLRLLNEQEEAKRERMPPLVVAKTEWGRYTHRENSFLTSLFYGQHSSRLRCTTCHFTSTTHDAWALLQVEIPDSPEAQLRDCLRAHFKDELLDDDNQWSCPRCKAPRRATKKLTMTRAPPFLVIALKRFKQNARGDQHKLHTSVRFPLTGLDIEEFVLPQPSAHEAQQIAQSYGNEFSVADESLSPPYKYDAYAVVRHLGENTRSGHYTAAVRDRTRECWRYFNDTKNEDFQPERLSPSKALDNDQAYLVFYQRRPISEQRSK